MKKTKAGMGGMKPHSKECPMSPGAGRGEEGFFSKVPGGSMTLPKPRFQTLQRCENTHFCCSKPPCLCLFVTTAWEINMGVGSRLFGHSLRS